MKTDYSGIIDFDKDKKKWISKEILKHPDGIEWLRKQAIRSGHHSLVVVSSDPAEACFEYVSAITGISLSNDEFKKLKSRWSTHKGRKSKINISVSIQKETMNKLRKIQGRHNLNKTLELMICDTYQRLRDNSITNLGVGRVMPLLDIHDQLDGVIDEAALGIWELSNPSTIAINPSLILSIIEKLSKLDEGMSKIVKQLGSLSKSAKNEPSD